MIDTTGRELKGLDSGFGLGELDLDDMRHDQAESAAAPDPPTEWLDLDQQGRARNRSRGGRPTLYTVPRVLALVAALFDGASRADAARRAGVGVSTFYVWLQLGRRGHPTFVPLAEAVANVEGARGLNVFFGQVISRGRFWKRFP